MLFRQMQYFWMQIRGKQTKGSVMVEAILILVDILTT